MRLLWAIRGVRSQSSFESWRLLPPLGVPLTLPLLGDFGVPSPFSLCFEVFGVRFFGLEKGGDSSGGGGGGSEFAAAAAAAPAAIAAASSSPPVASSFDEEAIPPLSLPPVASFPAGIGNCEAASLLPGGSQSFSTTPLFNTGTVTLSRSTDCTSSSIVQATVPDLGS